VVDPILWASLPFRNRTAFLDFLGDHAIWHHVTADVIFRDTGTAYKTFPLGGYGAGWHRAHQQEHQQIHLALGLAPPPDMENYSLAEEGPFTTWSYIHAQDHRLIRAAAGIP
jgi:hypothetical protein